MIVDLAPHTAFVAAQIVNRLHPLASDAPPGTAWAWQWATPHHHGARVYRGDLSDQHRARLEAEHQALAQPEPAVVPVELIDLGIDVRWSKE